MRSRAAFGTILRASVAGAALFFAPAAPAASGVVLEKVEPHGAGQLAGLEVGDRIESCSSGTLGWTLRTPFDLEDCEWELAPRGPTLLAVRRGHETLQIELQQGEWEIGARPELAGAEIQQLEEMRQQVAGGGAEPAAWGRLVLTVRDAGRGADAAWLSLQPILSRLDGSAVDLAEDALSKQLGSDAFQRSPRRLLAALAVQRVLLRSMGAESLRHVENAEALAQAAGRLEDRPLTAVRFLQRLALSQQYAGQFEAARQSLERSRSMLEEQRLEAGPLWGQHFAVAGSVHFASGDLEAAERSTLRAIEGLQAARPEGLGLAWAIGNLGLIHSRQGRFEEAIESYTRQAEIYLRRGDHSRAIFPLSNAAKPADRLGDFSRADDFYAKALAIVESGSLRAAALWGDRGYLHLSWWRLSSAREYSHKAHRILTGAGREGARWARSHARLGHLARYRGDLETAEGHYSEALATYRRLEDPAGISAHLNNLGNLARQRKDYPAALSLYRQGLELPDSGALALARSLSNMGRTLLLLERADEARPLLERSLNLKRRGATETLDIAASLMLLGDLERTAGRVSKARSSYREALAMHGRLVPGRPAEAENQIRLALLDVFELGEGAEGAGALLRAAVATLERTSPDTGLLAEALYHLARFEQGDGDASAARALYRRAAASLDAQWRTLGGTRDARLSWMHDSADIYRAWIRGIVEHGQAREAFEALQKYRARGFQDLLGRRELDFPLSERGRQIEAELVDLGRDRERLLDELGDGEATALFRERLAEISGHRTRLLAELRVEAPRLARAKFPQALGVAEIARHLEPGETLVSFLSGREETLVFALVGGSEPIRAARLNLPRERLADEIETWRALIERRRLGDLEAINRRGEELYDVLFAPLGDAVDEASRLVIVPDGPLHRLPFAALRREGQYLVERQPFRLVASATWLAHLAAREEGATEIESSAPGGAIAFGDPDFSTRDRDPSSQPRGLGLGSLERLPGSREEVRALSQALPPPVEILLGAAATERRAKALGDQSIVHFASHALVNENVPLSSALVLARSENDLEESGNGLLYAWEILEQMRLEASLVTLSACETALGSENAVQGPMGFVWAFHQAGARSVMASLWQVEDWSTGALMERVYQELASGASKDEALRLGQLDLWRTARPAGSARGVGGLIPVDSVPVDSVPVDSVPVDSALTDSASTKSTGTATDSRASRHPFYWAGFQLYGSRAPVPRR